MKSETRNPKPEIRAPNGAERKFCKAREARELLNCSDETLRVLREVHPGLGVDLTGRKRYWYAHKEILKLIGKPDPTPGQKAIENEN